MTALREVDCALSKAIQWLEMVASRLSQNRNSLLDPALHVGPPHLIEIRWRGFWNAVNLFGANGASKRVCTKAQPKDKCGANHHYMLTRAVYRSVHGFHSRVVLAKRPLSIQGKMEVPSKQV